MTSIRVLMALAAQYNLELHQMDVKTAFLNGRLDEEVYMAIHEGLKISSEKNTIAFTKANADQNVYVHFQENGKQFIASPHEDQGET
ncbi:hypothetical protein AXG93_4541s1050 [Marchantia polymorpha subsp. ruderalis]|uniref:Reverse transcriptase Ty1/copia-type domain-containing protein n=1 Tax=Marchantia polymorpha subsp. ruderalis TaxID=1480154 RepID=A0A176VUB2_MARPO|nr:hypothetical protein AXG93_4541s1050 [Marchantia polymorpha subsp. ruderalis]